MAICKTKKAWNKDSLVKALQDLQVNKLSLRGAAREYRVPCVMLHNKLSSWRRRRCRRLGKHRKRRKGKQQEEQIITEGGEEQQKVAKKASQKHQKQKTASGSRVTDQQKASHTRQHCVPNVRRGLWRRINEMTVQCQWSALNARSGSTCTVLEFLLGSILDLSKWALSATSVALKSFTLQYETLLTSL